MVVFTCAECGDSVKKSQVEKHFKRKCRHCNVLTCIDCLKDFHGNDYMEHIKCVSENEKYGGKNYQVKQSANKGEKKQMEWMDNLKEIVKSNMDMDSDVRQMLETIQSHDNVPRKRAKFSNFIKNIMNRGITSASIDKTWEFVQAALNKPNEDTIAVEVDQSSLTKNGEMKMFEGTASIPVQKSIKEVNNEKDTSRKLKRKNRDSEQVEEEAVIDSNGGIVEKKKKHKSNTDGDLNGNQSPSVTETINTEKSFNWDKIIVGLLRKKGSMKLVRMKKKLISEYISVQECGHKTIDQISVKVLKKLTAKNKPYKITHDTISLKNTSQ